MYVILTWEVMIEVRLMPPDTRGTWFHSGLSESLELKALSSERPNFIQKTSRYSKEPVITGSTARPRADSAPRRHAAVLAVTCTAQGALYMNNLEYRQQTSVPQGCALLSTLLTEQGSQPNEQQQPQGLSPTRGCKAQSFSIPARGDLSGQTQSLQGFTRTLSHAEFNPLLSQRCVRKCFRITGKWLCL